jgi:hypothetical protein
VPAAASATDFTINWSSGVYNPSAPVRTTPGAYTDTYAFMLAGLADFSGSLTTQRLSVNGSVVSDLDFTSVYLDKTAGGPFTRVNFSVPTGGGDALEVVNLPSTPLNAGSYLLTVNYNVDPASAINGASYGGTLNVGSTASPAPEPASWAMMVGGFGLLGAAMRRRKTSLSFA